MTLTYSDPSKIHGKPVLFPPLHHLFLASTNQVWCQILSDDVYLPNSIPWLLFETQEKYMGLGGQEAVLPFGYRLGLWSQANLGANSVSLICQLSDFEPFMELP